MRIIKAEPLSDFFKEPASFNENQLVFCRTVRITLEDGTQKTIILKELEKKDLIRTINELTHNANCYDYDKESEMLFFKPFGR